MNQANVSKVVSKLRVKINDTPRHLKTPQGPEGRINKIRKTVTALIKHERIELYYNRADEARGYAERLISDAIRYGDCHKNTMEVADFWLLEKQLVHKLFKVLVPRFQNCEASYTKMYKGPKTYPGPTYEVAVLELRGNPYPDLKPNTHTNKYLIHNVLLNAAKYDFRQQKYAEMANNIIEESNTSPASQESPNTKEPTTS